MNEYLLSYYFNLVDLDCIYQNVHIHSVYNILRPIHAYRNV
jgi:hypothetical protein